MRPPSEVNPTDSATAATAGAGALVGNLPPRHVGADNPADVPLPQAAYFAPQRIHLQRNARQHTPPANGGTAPPASPILVTANDGQGRLSYVDAEGRSGSAEMRGAQVGEQDLGLQFMPGSTAVPQAATRVTDATTGSVVSTSLTSGQPMARVASHYRDQLNRGGQVQESIPAAGELLLTTVDTQTGINRSVWLGQQNGQVLVRLMQATPPVATAGLRP